VETKNLIFLTVRFHENVHFIGFSSFVSGFHGIGRETGNEVQGFTQQAHTPDHLRCVWVTFISPMELRSESPHVVSCGIHGKHNLKPSAMSPNARFGSVPGITVFIGKYKKAPPSRLPSPERSRYRSVFLPGMIPLNRPGRDQPSYIGFKWKRKTSFFRCSFTSKCFILLGFCVRLLVYPPIPCKRETKLKALHNKRILPPLLAGFLNRHSSDGSASASPTHFPFHQTP
jgi:hypothetical protein